MTIKKRLILLSVCTVLFLIIAPLIIIYSMGYRVDFAHFKIVATGGIYVKALPENLNITIDSNIQNKTSFLSSYVFAQNLLPGIHTVSIKKDGYFDYQKNLEVKENQVAKLEQVILFKKNPDFELLSIAMESPFAPLPADNAYVIKNNNLYYSQNSTDILLTKPKNTLLIKNVLAFQILNNDIIYLGSDGLLYQYSIASQATTPLSLKTFPVNKKNQYHLLATQNIVALQDNQSLFLLNKNSGTLENFYNPVNLISFSPDNQKLLICNDHEILYSVLDSASASQEKLFLNRFSEKITNCQWLGNNYLIFVLGNNIIISEIDIRKNINTITLPQIIKLPNGAQIEAKNPKIYFNQSEKKLYLLINKTTLVSEKLIP